MRSIIRFIRFSTIARTWSVPCLAGAVFFMTALLPLPTNGAEPGSGELTTEQRGLTLSVFTYRPPGCAPRGVLLVFHGNSRNADDYRDYSRPFADKSCLTVYAPLFDRERFRGWRYHRGGVIRRDVIQWRYNWTVSIIQDLAKWALALEGGADRPLYLFGHSAGGQFVSRVAAYAPFTGCAATWSPIRPHTSGLRSTSAFPTASGGSPTRPPRSRTTLPSR